ncbi:MAG: DUF402 domain-containing protein [bacterium]
MPKAMVKIRGIYTTALTRLLLDHAYSLAQPSRQIQERFRISDNELEEDVSIRGRTDGQGLLITGTGRHLAQLLSLFRAHFFDMVTRIRIEEPAADSAYLSRNFNLSSKKDDSLELEIELPGASKEAMDFLRAGVTPTVKGHHLFKTVASEWVELAEGELSRSPFRRAELEKELLEQVILGPMKRHGFIALIHVHPEGRVLSLRGGKILSLNHDHLIIRREFSGGYGRRYDGLHLPIEEGDYGITQIIDHQWFIRHTYYSQGGSVKGRYWNINTPVEFYPDHIRYLDLHLDIIRKPGGFPRIIDQEKLEKAVAGGFISRELARKARETARSCLRQEVSLPCQLT